MEENQMNQMLIQQQELALKHKPTPTSKVGSGFHPGITLHPGGMIFPSTGK